MVDKQINKHNDTSISYQTMIKNKELKEFERFDDVKPNKLLFDVREELVKIRLVLDYDLPKGKQLLTNKIKNLEYEMFK